MSESRLKEIRKQIDQLDTQIITILAQRLKVAQELAILKKNMKLGARDELRERAVVDRAKEQARQLGVDPSFVESVMRLVMAQMVGEEREHMGEIGMWSRVQEAFKDFPAQLNVAKVIFKHGLRVGNDGDILCGNMRVPAVQIAEEAGVDRRVVDLTAGRILKDEGLAGIFSNLEPVAYLKGVAQQLGMGVVEIVPKDAAKPGIIKETTGVLAKFGISIRQAVADDPYLTPQPKLTIITDEPVKGDVIDAMRKLPSVRSVIVY
ncbi:MAG: chorismate mutase [Candidatus Hadarchaeota archaeon]